MNSDTLHQNWKDVCTQIASYNDIDQLQFSAIASRLTPQAMSDGFLMLTTENSFLKTWAEKSFISTIQRALLDIFGIPFVVLIEIDEESSQGNQNINSTTTNRVDTPISHIKSSAESNPVVPTPTNIQPPAIQHQLKEDITDIADQAIRNGSNSNTINNTFNDLALSTLTFENFVIGESNRMAYSMAVQVAEVPGRTALNPLFIYGKSGLGKTHLMRAIQNYINETQPQLNTIYVDSEELISGYTDAVAEHDREKSSYKNFKTFYESADVLLIDDIQFLQGKKQTLDIVFQIFNKLINQGKQIVLSADRAPKNIDIDERYSSRFVQGGTIDIQPPEVETKLAIVKSYINEYRSTEGNQNLSIPEDVQMYIAENSSSNIRELKGALTIVIYHTNLSKNGNISISEVSSLLENHFSGGIRKNLSVEDIQKQVEDFYRIRHSDLIGSSRSRGVMYPRQIAIYLCRQLLDLPFNDIGKKFNRDHSTIMHSVSKVENLLLENRDVQEEIEALMHMIKEL